MPIQHISQEFRQWTEDRGIRLRLIQPGKPSQNAYVKRFIPTVRHEWLDLTIFEFWSAKKRLRLRFPCASMRDTLPMLVD